MPEEEAALRRVPPNLRVLPVDRAQENVGLRKIGLRRSPRSPDTWDIFVAVRNYGARPHDVDLELQFGGARRDRKRMSLEAGRRRAGDLHAIARKAAGIWKRAFDTATTRFPQDDRAVIELPAESRCTWWCIRPSRSCCSR